MWDLAKRARFEALWEPEEDGVLTEAEQAELARMVEEIEAVEAAYLAPATVRLRAERAQIASRTVALQELIRRKEAWVQRVEEELTGIETKLRASEVLPPHFSS